MDDFGVSHQANDLIFGAFRQGVLTHASLMVNMPGSAQALEATKKFRKIKFGLHLNLSDSIGWAKFLTGATLGLISAQNIEQEVRRQIELVQKYVNPIAFINSHHNVHFWPGVFPTVVKLAKEYNIEKIRLPNRFISLSLKSLAIRLTGTSRRNYKNLRLSQTWIDLDWYNKRGWQQLIKNLPSNIEISCHPQASLKWLIENKVKLH